jgi:glycerol kinase
VLLAIDQGTTGTTCLVVDDELRTVGRGYREIRQHFPQPGWVEHDPEEIWESVLAAAGDALAEARATAHEVRAIGITNQRETTVVWEHSSGRPLQHAIVWQDRRTADRCRELPRELIRERTGLLPDPYFSATKLEWILKQAARKPQDLAFDRLLARLEADGRRGARDRRDECVAHAALRSRRARLGQRSPLALRSRA